MGILFIERYDIDSRVSVGILFIERYDIDSRVSVGSADDSLFVFVHK